VVKASILKAAVASFSRGTPRPEVYSALSGFLKTKTEAETSSTSPQNLRRRQFGTQILSGNCTLKNCHARSNGVVAEFDRVMCELGLQT